MNAHTASLLAVLTVGLVSTGCTAEREGAGAPKSTVKRTVLVKKEIAGLTGKDGQIVLVEVEAAGATGKHIHPVDEFLYILEGTGQIERPGQMAVSLHPGETMVLPSGQVHEMKNPSGTAGLKFLQFSVVSPGQALTMPAP